MTFLCSVNLFGESSDLCHPQCDGVNSECQWLRGALARINYNAITITCVWWMGRTLLTHTYRELVNIIVVVAC